MRLQKAGKYLAPLDDIDRKLFEHIAQGSQSITDEHFTELKDVFVAHGVFAVEINGEVIEL